MSNYWQIFKQNIFNKNSLISVFLIVFLYGALAIYLLNYRLVLKTVFGNSSILYKLKLLYWLLIGARSAFSSVDLFLLTLSSILFGLNIVLVIKVLKLIRPNGTKVKILIGGGGLLSIISTGCTSCGFSLLSVFGLGSIFLFLPFGSQTLYIVSIVMLIVSLINMLRKINEALVCDIK